MPFSYGEKPIILTDLLVAAWTESTNTYGTPVSLPAGQQASVEPEHDTDRLRGYGRVAATLSVPVGAAVTIGQGGIHYDALVIMAGVTDSYTGVAGNRIRRTLFQAGSNLPYFGMIGVNKTDPTGLSVVGLQAIKLDKYPDYMADGTENQFILSESAGYGIPVAVSNVYYSHHIKTYEDPTDWTTPTDGTSFLAFFTS